MEAVSEVLSKQNEIIEQNNSKSSSEKSLAKLPDNASELLARFNPDNKCYAIYLGDEVHYPNRTPKLMDVRSKYGDVIADSFLRIQVADSFKQLGIECSDISKATQNIALSLRGFGERLMLAEWLVVFHKLNNSTEVRREYNQANFVACLKRTIQEVYTRSGDVRYRMCKEETERDLSLIRKKCFSLDLMSVKDFDKESEQIQRFFDNKYFNY